VFALPYVHQHLQRFNQEEQHRVQSKQASLMRTTWRQDSSSCNKQRENQVANESHCTSSSNNYRVAVGQQDQSEGSDDEALTPKQRVARRKEMELRRRHLELKVWIRMRASAMLIAVARLLA
jgi:hypothetical protein